mmetsp:Transcript_15981/g.60910  ORF Transcript_15981/g.60910 Transcript_15981/m.60910 type:complete len:240 (-) Transcript_15981:1406-2125(-)
MSSSKGRRPSASSLQKAIPWLVTSLSSKLCGSMMLRIFLHGAITSSTNIPRSFFSRTHLERSSSPLISSCGLPPSSSRTSDQAAVPLMRFKLGNAARRAASFTFGLSWRARIRPICVAEPPLSFSIASVAASTISVLSACATIAIMISSSAPRTISCSTQAESSARPHSARRPVLWTSGSQPYVLRDARTSSPAPMFRSPLEQRPRASMATAAHAPRWTSERPPCLRDKPLASPAAPAA